MIGRRRREDGPAVLVEQCQAFLDGRLGELTDRAGHPRTASAWLNALAHGDMEQLESLAAGDVDRARGPGARWAHAASFLAAEILRVGDDGPDAVPRVQVDAPVPVELRWASDSGTYPRPADLVGDVRGALERRPRRHPDRRRGRV